MNIMDTPAAVMNQKILTNLQELIDILVQAPDEEVDREAVIPMLEKCKGKTLEEIYVAFYEILRFVSEKEGIISEKFFAFLSRVYFLISIIIDNNRPGKAH
jgi:hypothetical protein